MQHDNPTEVRQVCNRRQIEVTPYRTTSIHELHNRDNSIHLCW